MAGQGPVGGAPRGTQDRFPRWTKAKMGTGAEMALLKQGEIKGSQRRGRAKRK